MTEKFMKDSEKLLKEAADMVYNFTGARMSQYETDGQYIAVINENLDAVMVPEMPPDELYYKSGGLYQAVIADSMGYFDEAGKNVISCKYKIAYPFSDSGLAFVMTHNGEAAYINKDDKVVITLSEGITDGGIFEHGLSFISDDETYTFINEKGEEVFEEKFLFTDGFAKNGLAVVEDENNIFKAIDTKGNVVFELPKGVSTEGFHKSDNATVIRKKNKLGIIDSKGNIISECLYKEILISRYSGKYLVKDGKNWTLLDEDGNPVTRSIFKNPTRINKQGYFATHIDEKSEEAKNIEGYSKTSLYVFETISGDTRVEDVIPNVKSAEISQASPILTITYKIGAKVMYNIEEGEANNGIISDFFSAFCEGEAMVNLPGDVITRLLFIFNNLD